MTDLRIADDLALPLNVTTEKLAILGQSGSGKSYAAMRLAELLYGIGAQVVVLDPVGPWFGLRIAADGEHPGLPIVVFGGEHGDLPLDPRSGELVADVIVDQTISAVIDLSDFEMADQKRFTAAFAERLFHRKKRAKSPLHLILEEAQVFAPQTPEKDETVMLNRIERLARIGRNYGIGWTIVSQRPQEVHKKVLNQAGTLFALRTVGRHERKAIEDWVADKSSAGDAEMVRSLPSLETGTAHVWSPAFLRTSTTVQISKRETFDSSATPSFDDVQAEPRVLAPVDLEHLQQRMAATIERAKSDDPKELRTRVKDLERQLVRKSDELPEPKVERIEVPVLSDEMVERVTSIADSMVSTGMKLIDGAGELRAALISAKPLANIPKVIPRSDTAASVPYMPTSFKAPPRSAQASDPIGDVKLSKAERSILTVLAQYPAGRTKNQVALLTSYSVIGGGFNNAISSLRSKGWLVGSKDSLEITADGLSAIDGQWEALPTGEALLNHWMSHLGKAERSILFALWHVFPDTMDRSSLALATDYAETGGGFNNAISRLRSLELIGGSKEALRASEALFDGARR